MQKETFLECAMAHERTLYRVAKTILRSDADCADAVQEALLKGLRHVHLLRSEAFAQTWLTRILINTCKDMLRKSSRQQTVALTDMIPSPDKEEQRELYEALQTLEEKLRLPLVLHYLEGFPVRDISRMLRVPEGTVKRRLWQARKEMRELLSQEAI